MKKIERRGKTSLNSFLSEDEILSPKINSQSTSKRTSFSETETKPETRTIKKTSTYSKLRSSLGDDFENPKERKSHTENIHSSKRTEKNEESTRKPKRNINHNDIETNLTQKDLDNFKWENTTLFQCIPKKQKRISQNKRNKVNNVNKRDPNDKKHKFLTTIKPDLKKNKTQSEDFHLGVEKKKHNVPVFSSQEVISKEQFNKQNQLKKRKPSEIPLRKSRIEASRKLKPVSTYLQKSLEEVESTNSFDYFFKKPCSPIEEVHFGSELQITVNAVCSCDDITESDFRTYKPQELHNEIRLERCSKNFDIPTSTSSICENLSEEKSRMLTFLTDDLNKVKTSSFTILQTNPTVFDRLESLHKQNILSKEKINGLTSKKSRPLTPKQSFHSVKVKTIRRNSRSPNKKNKSNIKIKAKKSKKKIQDDFSSFFEKSTTNEKESHIIILQKLLEAGGFKTDSYESEKRCSTPIKLCKDGEKITKKVRNSRERDELRISTPQRSPRSPNLNTVPIQDVENTKKQKPTANVAKNKPNSINIKSRNRSVTPKSSLEKTKKHKIKKREEKDSKTSLSKIDNKSTGTYNDSENSSKLTNEAENIENIENEVLLLKSSSLILRGTALRFEKEEREIQEEVSKVKKQLKIDLNLQNTAEENVKRNQFYDSSSYKNDKNETKTPTGEEKTEKNVLQVVRDKENHFLKTELNLKEDVKSSVVTPVNTQNKVSNQKPKGVRKKQRSDAGDRPTSFGPYYGPNILPSSESESRNSLAKSQKNEKEIFEEVSLKLRRSSSEPNSFNGYVWKRTDFPIFKGHKPSVSSMASSLKHLNTDDIDDFSFWEAIPQKMSYCWEMSLYNFQKPWTVLSRSVFRDNRLSNTPGLILQNLRNGGKLNKKPSPKSQKESVNYVKENPFDVEPSIAQKNIDIRNWLAALNFPTSSTPTNVISEEISTSDALVDPQRFNKLQANPKRRKIFRNTKFPEETKLTKDKNQCSGRKINEIEGLKDLVRRKSGGFVISEEKVNIQHSKNQPRDSLKSYLTSTTTIQTNNRNITSKLELDENREPSSATVSHLPLPQIHNSIQLTENPQEIVKKITIQQSHNSQSKTSSKNFPLQFNIWKYLFILTIFIIIIHYYYYYYYHHSEMFAYSTFLS